MVISCLTTFSNAEEVNWGFEEYPVDPGTFDFFETNPYFGWQTDFPNGKIEIWGSGFMGIDSHEGIRFTELNTYSIYRDLSTIPANVPFDISFAHRARVNSDLVKLTVIDLVNGNHILSQDFEVTDDFWLIHQAHIAAHSGNLRITFTPIPTQGSNSGGNYIDSVSFKYPVPAPASMLLLFAGAYMFVRPRRERHL